MSDTRVTVDALDVTDELSRVEFPGDSGFASLPYTSLAASSPQRVEEPRPGPGEELLPGLGPELLPGPGAARLLAPGVEALPGLGPEPLPSLVDELDGTATQRAPAGRAQRFLGVATPCLAVMGLAALFRIVLPSGYDVFQDEVNYVDLSTSIRQGHYPPHFLNQGVFLLHPPLLFLIGAGWQELVHPGGNYFQLVDSMRLLTALFAVTTAGLIFGIAYRIAGRRFALAAGVLFAVEPYALRTNGRVLLETAALTFVLAGYFLLLGLTREHLARSRVHARSGLRRRLLALSAGLVLGLGIVTLELTAIITIGPLLVLLWRRWCFERRYAALALIGTLIPYGAYVVSLVVTHHIHAYYVQDSSGLKRILGLERTTGFNAAGSPSLVHTLISQAGSFGTTYVLAVLGVVAGIYPLLRRNDDFKLMGAVVICGAVAILYEGLFGTIEEQFLYILLIPALVAIAAASSDILRRRRSARRRMRTLPVFVAIGFIAISLYDVGVWAYTRSRPDNGLARTVSFLKANVPHKDVVATNALVSTYVLEHSSIPAVTLTTPSAAAHSHVRYLTVLSAELQGHYGAIDVQQARWYAAHGRVIFSFDEATYGKILVYETTNSAAW